MFIENDMEELLRRAGCMIAKRNAGDFLEPGDVVNMAFIKMFDKGQFYEKGIFARLMQTCVTEHYQRLLTINNPIAIQEYRGTFRPSKLKTCSCCKETIPACGFSLYFSTKHEGWLIATECPDCVSKRQKKHIQDRPDLHRARMQRHNERKVEKRAKEKQELTDEYMIKRILKHIQPEWLAEHPEYIDKERRLLKRKLQNKAA